MLQIQIVSTMRNEAKNLPLFVQMIDDLRLSLKIDLKAVIVNNGSTDNTDVMINGEFSKVKYIKFLNNPIGSSYADGIELAIKNCETSYALLVPTDLQFSKTSVKHVLSLFLASPALNDSKSLAIFTRRTFRRDGLFNVIRGKIWRSLSTLILRVDRRLDPASQLRIIPIKPYGLIESRNFIWDIELMCLVLNNVTEYQVADVEFLPRKFGESSVGQNLLKSSVEALSGIVSVRKRLSH
jgi:hypothetical protein